MERESEQSPQAVGGCVKAIAVEGVSNPVTPQALAAVARAYGIPANGGLVRMILPLDHAARQLGAALDKPLADAVRRAAQMVGPINGR